VFQSGVPCARHRQAQSNPSRLPVNRSKPHGSMLMIGLLHTHGRLALGFGALLLPIALVCAPAHGWHSGMGARLGCEP
jgi:hypothetical protein